MHYVNEAFYKRNRKRNKNSWTRGERQKKNHMKIKRREVETKIFSASRYVPLYKNLKYRRTLFFSPSLSLCPFSSSIFPSPLVFIQPFRLV